MFDILSSLTNNDDGRDCLLSSIDPFATLISHLIVPSRLIVSVCNVALLSGKNDSSNISLSFFDKAISEVYETALCNNVAFQTCDARYGGKPSDKKREERRSYERSNKESFRKVVEEEYSFIECGITIKMKRDQVI